MKFPDLGLNAPIRLRDLIRQIRSVRTAAEEREVVQKESAAIRDSFRDEDNNWRCRNVAKLLYIHMLGYPAHFGQLECLKLVASSNFTDKRIGYLGAALLLDERQDVHLLITNSLKNDLSHSNQYVVGLALSTLAAICSPEMCRDLASEVEKFVKCSNPFLKKKGILCAVRIISKIQEFTDIFMPLTRSLLNDKNHGVLCGGVTLMIEICKQSPESIVQFRKMVPCFVRVLKNLLLSGYSPEHDVCGISDPFLQVYLLRLMRMIGKDDVACSEAMNDVLAQVATNTENAKNVGNAVLYETVLTIMAIKSDSGLRVLAVNILGRFLINNDKNVRYVALSTLLRVVHHDNIAVQRHRATILECLNDSDISVKRRAMELSFALANRNNIELMIEELHSFLASCEDEFKSDCTSNMFALMDRFYPNRKWQIDQTIRILKTAGNFVRDDITSSAIGLISSSPDLHLYACVGLYERTLSDITQQSLCQVTCWCLGEYGDLLLTPAHKDSSFVTHENQVTDNSIIDLLEKILCNKESSIITRCYVLNALMKLSTRIPSIIDRVRWLLSVYTSSIHLELQTRANEYSTIFQLHDHLRNGIFDVMPSFKCHSASLNISTDTSEETTVEPEAVSHTEEATSNLLLDLDSNNSPPVSKSNDVLHPPAQTIPSITAFDKNDLHITFDFERPDKTSLMIKLTAFNSSFQPMKNFIFQAAVPKSFKLNMQTPSGSEIPPHGEGILTQILTINNPQQEPVRLRIRVNYQLENGERVLEESIVNNFPKQCWL